KGLNQDVSHLKHKNMKLEALLLGRQEELNALTQQFAVQIKSPICQKANLNSSLSDPALTHNANARAIWSKGKIVMREPTEKDAETKTDLMGTSQEKSTEEEEGEEESEEDNDDEAPNNPSKKVSLLVQSPEREFEEEKDVPNWSPSEERNTSPLDVENVGK